MERELIAFDVECFDHETDSAEWEKRIGAIGAVCEQVFSTLVIYYIRCNRPDIKEFIRSSIYNMVLFYDEYSSDAFALTVERYLTAEFVQPKTGQIGLNISTESYDTIVQSKTAQSAPSINAPMPKILGLTTLSNHIEILCRCKNNEERL